MVDVTSVDIVAIVTELNIVVVTKSSNLVAGFLEQPYKLQATIQVCNDKYMLSKYKKK